jgi:hypothetical protein
LSQLDPASYFPRLAHRAVSEFETKEYLTDALVASSTIPFFTGSPWLFSWFEGRRSLDAGFTCNTPVFRDRRRDQLVINLGFLQYSLKNTFSPLDLNHERLVQQGIDDAVRMLRGEVGIWALRVLRAHEQPDLDRPAWRVFLADVHHFFWSDVVPWTLYSYGAIGLFSSLALAALVDMVKTAVRSRWIRAISKHSDTPAALAATRGA